jgi:hypothetical protein
MNTVLPKSMGRKRHFSFFSFNFTTSTSPSSNFFQYSFISTSFSLLLILSISYHSLLYWYTSLLLYSALYQSTFFPFHPSGEPSRSVTCWETIEWTHT